MKFDIQKVDLTNQNQKIFAGILVVLTLGLLWYLLPPFIVLMTNLWLAAVLAIPAIFVICNPMLMWNVYKQLSWNLTKKLIGQDKLGYMYRYHEYLLTKIDALDGNIKNISQIRNKVQRKIGELKQNVDNNKKKAGSYQDKNSSSIVLKALANKIAVDTKTIESLLPQATSVQKQEQYLIQLHSQMSQDAEDLKYTLDAKAEEYKTLKELSEATGNASEFLKGNSEEYKLYQESLKQIEESVTKYTANIDNFERKAKPMLEAAALDRTVSEEEGMKLIEEFKKNTVTLKIEG